MERHCANALAVAKHLEDHAKVQVWDSNSEIHYLVLPERPAGTEGMSEKNLAALGKA